MQKLDIGTLWIRRALLGSTLGLASFSAYGCLDTGSEEPETPAASVAPETDITELDAGSEEPEAPAASGVPETDITELTLAEAAAASAACSTWGARGSTTAGGGCACGNTRAVAMVSQQFQGAGVSKWGTGSRAGRSTRVRVVCWSDYGRRTTVTSAWTRSSSGARATCPSSHPGAEYSQCQVK
jgi:hypothetical protein